ncbi:cysteine desulfurase [[Clostridium] leptum CAG:27]|uniref:cysteine desulfurase n=1 Tax=[Clostridium] leptum CAG:27 TaxID=1263068 RepID=R6N0P5_9FIRM|nr:cysteine desulfurase [[Clostridium] leptum CAG:27]
MKQHIYADNAATTKLDKTTLEAMLPWLLEEYGNASQLYAFARKPKKALADARATIAECIGALPEEIYFTSGGTESDNWVIKSSAFSDSKKQVMITSAFEHHAILHSCSTIEHFGYPVVYMSPSNEGYITPENLEKHITENTRLVSIIFANNELGSIQPIQELCKVAHAHGALFHTDAVQAVGHIKINVHELGVDFLSASAHKFNGPKGIGFLFIRKGAELRPYVDGGSQENLHRAGTENIASIVGMAAALKTNSDSLDKNQLHILKLEKQLLARLDESGVVYRCNCVESKLPGLLSLSFPDKDGEAILHRMDLMGISISTGSACDSVNAEISHVLKAIHLAENYAKGTIRISLGKNNTQEDVENIVASLVKIVS